MVSARRLMAVFLIILSGLWGALLFAQPPIRITFERDEIGKFPSGWVSRDKKDMVKVYSVQAEADQKFLHADAKGLSVQMACEKEWALKALPILRWQWRAVIFPTGTNEREKGGNDSVLGVYVILRGWPFVRAIKYLWSDTLPVGSSFESPFSSGTKMVVVRSGRTLVGTWVAEERNVLADYRQLFGEKEKNPVAKGIAFLTDADNTNSRAVGDYGDIEILAAQSPP